MYYIPPNPLIILEISEKKTVLLVDVLLLELSSETKAEVDGVEGVTGATDAIGLFRGWLVSIGELG